MFASSFVVVALDVQKKKEKRRKEKKRKEKP